MIKDLEGWESLPVAAVRLSVKRQRIFQMIGEGKMEEDDLRKVAGAGIRPAAYLVRTRVVDGLLEEQKAAVKASTAQPPVSVAV